MGSYISSSGHITPGPNSLKARLGPATLLEDAELGKILLLYGGIRSYLPLLLHGLDQSRQRD